MHHYTCLAVTLGTLMLVLATSSSSASTIPVLVCPPGLKNVPASLHKLCIALMEDVPPEEGDIMEAPFYDPRSSDRSVKRQDVDHVFLRFGRRNGL